MSDDLTNQIKQPPKTTTNSAMNSARGLTKKKSSQKLCTKQGVKKTKKHTRHMSENIESK